jgi:hypothetical protein
MSNISKIHCSEARLKDQLTSCNLKESESIKKTPDFCPKPGKKC